MLGSRLDRRGSRADAYFFFFLEYCIFRESTLYLRHSLRNFSERFPLKLCCFIYKMVTRTHLHSGVLSTWFICFSNPKLLSFLILSRENIKRGGNVSFVHGFLAMEQ